ncbi:hypothetical protein B0A77_10345 [Flavobacterium branchiophilum]|uniref:Uncharacterized protein n=1 Tax=Flavobacterium branchiophilum TaxID=55197 RepID=A0A2H3KC25_9FLAO|nr:hypothetical protein B0A77_10345 [Flavobacterium branchiophilum]
MEVELKKRFALKLYRKKNIYLILITLLYTFNSVRDSSGNPFLPLFLGQKRLKRIARPLGNAPKYNR